MDILYDKFLAALGAEDKPACVRLAINALKQGDVNIVSLYEKILAPALTSIAGPGTPQSISIWQEHVRTEIVETIMGYCYPHILSQITWTKKAPKVLVFCPVDEYHHVGAKMVSDYFTLCGYHTYYIGANTPASQFLGALTSLSPRYIAISVSSVYHLRATRSAIDLIRQETKEPVKIIVGGHAFSLNPAAAKEVGADVLLHTFTDIESLAKGDGLL